MLSRDQEPRQQMFLQAVPCQLLLSCSPIIRLMPLSSLHTVATWFKGLHMFGLLLLTFAAPAPLPSGPAPEALHAFATLQEAMKCMALHSLPRSAAASWLGYVKLVQLDCSGFVTQLSGVGPLGRARLCCCCAVTDSARSATRSILLNTIMRMFCLMVLEAEFSTKEHDRISPVCLICTVCCVA